MKFTSFRGLLLKKAEDNAELQDLIKIASDDFLSEHILEILEKMAEDRIRPRSSNKIVTHFGDNSLDRTGDMANMIHDALSHHASHYKAAINSNQDHLASQHMKKIHNIMHLSRKIGHDGPVDHGDGKLKIEAIDPKPWERSGFPKLKEGGGTKKFVTDTKGWSRDGGSYSYMKMAPHESYDKETRQGHGHTGAYPLEEIKVNGKHLHIDDNVQPKGYEGHEFDEHPIIKNGLYKKPVSAVTDEMYDKYLKDLEDYETSDHMDKYYDRHESMQNDDPEGYAARGTNKPDKVISDPGEASKGVLESLSEDETNDPANKKLIDGIKSGAFGSLDDDMILRLIRGTKGNVEKALTDIKESLVKNKDFLIDNPDILIAIRDKLVKAASDDDDEASQWLRDNDPSYQEGQYNHDDDNLDYVDDYGQDNEGGMAGLFDNPEEEEYGAEDEDIRHVSEDKPEYIDITEADKPSSAPVETKRVAAKEPEGKKKSRRATWEPRTDYTPEQQKKISDFVNEGYHPGDAEMLIGAHKRFSTIGDAARKGVDPHIMSDKIHDHLRELAQLHMKDVALGEYSGAEPELNPQKATAGTIKSYHDLSKDFKDKKAAFEDSDDFKNMSPRERHKARREWIAQYHKDNPEYEQSLKRDAASHRETAIANTQKRSEQLEEGRKAIAQAGQLNPESSGSISSGSEKMAAGPEGTSSYTPTAQGAFQSAGISTDENEMASGTTIKDPYSTFAEKNPELKAKYTKRISDSLDDKAKARLHRINTLKGK